MEVQVRTDRHVPGGRELASFVGYELLAGLGACAARVACAYVQVSLVGRPCDREHGMRCELEVRPRDHAPVMVTRLAATGDAAVHGAVDDMRRVLERMFHRIDGRPLA